MIKRFKKGSYKITFAAVICGIIAAGITLTNAVGVKNVNAETSIDVNINTNEASKEENKFLIDTPLKAYDNFKKAKNIVGYNFKLPDFMPDGYKMTDTFQVLKVSDEENSLGISFSGDKKEDKEYYFQVSKSNPVEVLRIREKQYARVPNAGKEIQIEFGEEPSVILGNINERMIIERYTSGEIQTIIKYFAWQDDGIWYFINYDEVTPIDEINKRSTNISMENLKKIASSIKYPEEAKNIDYYKVKDK